MGFLGAGSQATAQYASDRLSSVHSWNNWAEWMPQRIIALRKVYERDGRIFVL